MRAGMSPGAASDSWSVSNSGTVPWTSAASASSPARSIRAPSASSQARTVSFSSHRPVTLCRKRTRPSTPRSLVKPRLPGRRGQDRLVELDPDQAPRAARDVGGVGRRQRRGHDGRGGVVRADRDHVERRHRPRRRRPPTAGRRPSRGRPGAAAAWAGSPGARPGRGPTPPTARRAGRWSRRSSARRPDPRQEPRQEVRDEQRGLGRVQPALGRELVERGEGQVLQAVAAVELLEGHECVHRLHAGGRARVAVVERFADQLAGRRPGRSRRPTRRRRRWRSRARGRRAAARPATTWSYSPATSQCRPSARRTAPFGKRAASTSSSVPGPSRPTITRPLVAPRSTAATRRGRRPRRAAASLIAGSPRRRRRRPGRAGRSCG